jgi:ABC-2 type transport system ATP-binding protein
VKQYGSKRIGPIDISVNKGEIFGFLGPNGSGKTTCIRLLLGLTRPSSGKVSLNGIDPLRRHVEALNRVGYSPELPNLQNFLTPEELLALTASELSIEAHTRTGEIQRVLETVGLIEYTDTKIGKLSKGMIQRLGVGQALLGSPETLVLDEPMIGLDPAGSAHLREVFRDFSRNGGTIFLSSHMMSEVEELCSTIGLLHRGKLLLNGRVEDVVSSVLGTEHLVVEAKGVTEACLKAIRETEGVLGVETHGGVLDVYATQKSEVRPRLAQIIVASGAQLYTIKRGERLLERAYIEALKRDDNAN